MACVKVPSGRVCFSPSYQVKVRGRLYRFEWHSYFGPTFLRRRDGEPWDPPMRHPVWVAASAYVQGLAAREGKEE